MDCLQYGKYNLVVIIQYKGSVYKLSVSKEYKETMIGNMYTLIVSIVFICFKYC